jgi:hypothetical protein
MPVRRPLIGICHRPHYSPPYRLALSRTEGTHRAGRVPKGTRDSRGRRRSPRSRRPGAVSGVSGVAAASDDVGKGARTHPGSRSSVTGRDRPRRQVQGSAPILRRKHRPAGGSSRVARGRSKRVTREERDRRPDQPADRGRAVDHPIPDVPVSITILVVSVSNRASAAGGDPGR